MKNQERSDSSSAEPHARRPADGRADGVLDSIGKAIFAPIAGAAEDELLPDEDLLRQRKIREKTPSSLSKRR